MGREKRSVRKGSVRILLKNCKKLVCVLLAVMTVIAMTSIVTFAEGAADKPTQEISANDDTIIEVIVRGEGTLVERLIHGGQVTLVGMIIVFAVLIVLMIILYIFPIIFGRKSAKETEKTVEKSVSAPVNVSVPVNVHEVVSAPSAQETELVAVATAAIAAARGESDCAFNVISITPIN